MVPPPPPVTFHCAKDASCPEILVAGDPFAETNQQPDLFRGYGDPSLELDPDTGTLWMSYSWLNVVTSDPGPPPVVDFGVRTHLARSDDNGQTFAYVRDINQVLAETHPDTGVEGWAIHEVSTLVREASGQWQVMWFHYLDPFGDSASRHAFRYDRSTAMTPGQLGDSAEAWIRGSGTSASFGVQHDLSLMPELADCTAFTEPGLYADATGTYLATSCIVIDGQGVRQTAQERLVLLREEGDGYSFVSVLLDAMDATDLGADRMEQADIALARDGTPILMVTPIVDNADPMHQGCVVFEFENFASGSILRDGGGTAVSRTIITADGNGLGPGLCTYDASSDTGILLVITSVSENPLDIEFSLRATGIHP